VEINTPIPQSRIFRFENFWLSLEDFLPTVISGWNCPGSILDSARMLSAKFKNLRKVIREWRKSLPNLSLAIEKIKLVLNFLETIELFRDLSLPEWNFRNLVTEKLIYLLKQQRTYWKQRGKIRWVKEGDAGTRFFHSHATIRHRKNNITSLLDPLGNHLVGHGCKAELLWNSYKDRMGQSDFNRMILNLEQLLQPAEGLDVLETPLTRSEIDGVVSNLPNNKSPGPDGFSNEFIKECWPLVASDFYKLCEDFQSANICLRSINNSYIVLIPKKRWPSISV
jgi:hypothetical protein